MIQPPPAPTGPTSRATLTGPTGPAAAVVERARTGQDVTDLGVLTPAEHVRTVGRPERDGRPEHVWYVSYGSNLLRERFERYLLGGRLPGLDVVYPSGPDLAPATDDRAVVLPGRLRFALDAPSWGGGGVAFWDPVGPGPGVLARAWRVRLSQFLEVVHLENGGRDRRAALWPDDVLRTGRALVGDGWYSRLLCPGRLGEEPALTFTHPDPAVPPTRAPSPAYRSVVARGVVETFAAPDRGGLDDADADAYLAGALTG